MKLGTKHENQFQIICADFTGGLNTRVNSSEVAENQFARAVNVEIDHATGKLKTVAGAVDVLEFGGLFAAMYDDINRKLLLVDADKKIYVADLESGTVSGNIAALSGDLYPICASWEDGLLIASGDRLQYFNGQNLLTIENSPKASSVCVQAGRVLVADEKAVYFSGVGDEWNWTEDVNDDSSAKFLEVGYKDGGALIGMVSLQGGVLLLKDNRRAYRLNIGFPEWSLVEVANNVEVGGRLSMCAVADLVFALGRDEVQNIQAANVYGNVKPQDIAALVTGEIQALPENALLRYVPKLNQLWALNGEEVLMFDLATQSWYKRQFNSPVLDVIPMDGEVLIVKGDRVSKLDENVFSDSGEELAWEFKCKRRISHHDFLLKHSVVSFTPLDIERTDGQILIGKVVINLSLGESGSSTRRRLIRDDEERPTVLAQCRNVYRNKFLDIGGHGSAGGIIFNSITLDVVEV